MDYGVLDDVSMCISIKSVLNKDVVKNQIKKASFFNTIGLAS